MSKVIKSGTIAHDHAPFDAEELFAAETATGNDRHSGGHRATLAQEITSRSQLVKLVKEEMADLVARVEEMAARRAEEAESAKRRAEEAFAAARAQGWELGRQEGYRAGYEEGIRAGRESYRELLRTAQRVLDEAKAIKQRAAQEVIEDVVKLSVAVASKLVPVAMDHCDAARALVSEMLRKAEGAAFARVRVAKAALEAIGDGEGLDVPDGLRVEFAADESLGPGDVVVETEWGIVDGRLRARWERILRGLDLLEASAGGLVEN